MEASSIVAAPDALRAHLHGMWAAVAGPWAEHADYVYTVAFNPNATDRCTVLVNWNTAGIAAQTERQPGYLDVRTGEGRKLHAIEGTAGAKINARRKMFLDDEAGRARVERVAARAE